MRSMPFDSKISGYDANGIPQYDRPSSAAEFARLLAAFLTNGIWGGGMFAVTAKTGMQVSVSEGHCLINGRFGFSDAPETLEFAADGTYPRIDSVVLRMDVSAPVRAIVLDVHAGVAAQAPQPPALTRDGTVWELGIANVLIPANSSAIAQERITDTRLDTTRCGLVAAINSRIDTTALYNQIQADLDAFKTGREADFDEWFAGIQTEVERVWSAAAYIEGTTVSARKLDPGSTPTAQASTVDGHLHVEYGLVTGDRGEQGPGYTIKGPAYATVGALAAAVTSPAEGDQYNVGIAPPYNIYRWTGAEWEDQGALQGPPGAPGNDGDPGPGVARGGTKGQVLTKASAADFDTAWATIETGSMDTQVIITLVNSDGSSAAGRTVTVSNVEDGSVFERFTYSGQPHTSLVPVAARYRVETSAAQHYVTPEPVEYTAIANTPRAITLTYKYGIRYGYRREKANSSPTDRITYLYDAVGMTPMSVNLSTGVPNYGSWQEFVDNICRPVMLRYDGTVDYELDHNDQTKKAGSGEASDVANTNYAGNAMVEFGSAFKWVKRYEDSSYEYVIFSNTRFDDSYHAYAHTNANGAIKDAFYWGMFKGTNVSSKLRSIGAGSVMVNETRTTEISRAQANGSGTDQTANGYYTIYKSGWDYIADLLTLISKSDNSQAAFGRGRCNSSNTAASAAGTLKAKGAFWGSSDETSDVKVFYIEGFWGNAWEGMAGLILDGTKGIKTKMVPPYNTTCSGYDSTGIVPSGTSGGFVATHSCTDASGYVPKMANGSETTYMCDGLWFNTGQVDYAIVGGSWATVGKCGSRYVALLYLASKTTDDSGSRLSFIPV